MEATLALVASVRPELEDRAECTSFGEPLYLSYRKMSFLVFIPLDSADFLEVLPMTDLGNAVEKDLVESQSLKKNERIRRKFVA